jgi:hypothetical protein
VKDNNAVTLIRKQIGACALLVIFAMTLIGSVRAQETQAIGKNLTGVTTISRRNQPASFQGVVAALSNLPETDTLIYVSPQRILSDALPRLLPAPDLTNLRSTLSGIQLGTGIDPAKIEYVVGAVRFNKPTADLNFSPPQFMVVAGGDFSTDAVMLLARQALNGKLRDETYAGKTISLMTIDDLAKQAATNPFAKSLSEVAIAPLNANTIAAGTVAYVKAAIDASQGKDRISADTIKSLLRDPTALVSFAGTPLTSFAKSFGLLGTEANARASNCTTKFGDFYAGLTMDVTTLKLRGAMNADNTDTAKIIQKLLSGLLEQAKNSAKDKSAQSLLSALSITPEDNEVVLQADVPQQAVADFIREQNAKKKQEAAKPKGTSSKPMGRRRHRAVHRTTTKTGL